MLPGVICRVHFVFGGQQVRLPPTVQQARPLRQHSWLAQHRLVFLSQHFVPHSSWFALHRLHNPRAGLAQRQLVGQHFWGPQRARPCGHLSTQTPPPTMPTRNVTHSSLSLQHRVLAQHSSPSLQHPDAHLVPTHGHVCSPGLPHLVPGGHAAAPAVPKQQQVDPATPHWLRHVPGVAPGQLQTNGNGSAQVGGQAVLSCGRSERPKADLGRSVGTAAATTAPPMSRSTRDRGIGVARVRATSSRNSLTRGCSEPGLPSASSAALRNDVSAGDLWRQPGSSGWERPRSSSQDSCCSNWRPSSRSSFEAPSPRRAGPALLVHAAAVGAAAGRSSLERIGRST
jgi:hypothetical protein